MPIIAYEIVIFSGENSTRVPFEFGAFTTIYGSLLLSQVVVMVLGIIITEALNKVVNLKKSLMYNIEKKINLNYFKIDFFLYNSIYILTLT